MSTQFHVIAEKKQTTAQLSASSGRMLAFDAAYLEAVSV